MKRPGYRFSKDTYQQLLTIFQPEIDCIEAFIGLDFAAWKLTN